MVAVEAPSSRGRPRDPQIDEAVIAATLSLLEEVGFAGTTIQAVARRAGVGAPAIYRRWANRIELIESAVFPILTLSPRAPSGDLRADLQRYIDLYSEMFQRPGARVAIPALLSAYQSAPERNKSVSQRVGVGVRSEFRELLAGAPADEVDSDVDPDAVLDLLIGSVIYRVFMHPFTGRRATDDSTAELLLRALRPKTKEAK